MTRTRGITRPSWTLPDKGARVKNFQNEDIGAIDELLIEPPSGHVRFLSSTSAGFWRIGGTRVCCAVDRVPDRQRRLQAKLCYRCSKDFLEKAPRVDTKSTIPYFARGSAEPVFTLLARDLATFGTVKAGSPAWHSYSPKRPARKARPDIIGVKNITGSVEEAVRPDDL